MNNITLIGNLCKNFEQKQTNSGLSVATNSIAVKRDRKEADGTYATDFFDFTCFGAQADYATKYLKKGDKVCINGSIHIRDYTSKAGNKGRAIEISVMSLENLTPKGSEATKETEITDTIDDLDDDEMPF